MDNRELLELAAKAAGINGAYFFETYDDLICDGIWANDEDDCSYQWNPLTDDGDALRLAVKLRLLWDEMELFDLHFDSKAEDPCAATRRAIVRAAAEIGMIIGEEIER